MPLPPADQRVLEALRIQGRPANASRRRRGLRVGQGCARRRSGRLKHLPHGAKNILQHRRVAYDQRMLCENR
jgi:hypothetical protein